MLPGLHRPCRALRQCQISVLPSRQENRATCFDHSFAPCTSICFFMVEVLPDPSSIGLPITAPRCCPLACPRPTPSTLSLNLCLKACQQGRKELPCIEAILRPGYKSKAQAFHGLSLKGFARYVPTRPAAKPPSSHALVVSPFLGIQASGPPGSASGWWFQGQRIALNKHVRLELTSPGTSWEALDRAAGPEARNCSFATFLEVQCACVSLSTPFAPEQGQPGS